MRKIKARLLIYCVACLMFASCMTPFREVPSLSHQTPWWRKSSLQQEDILQHQRALRARVLEYLETHPHVSAEIKDSMLDRMEIIHGMDAEQVEVVLGVPKRKINGNSFNADECWIYTENDGVSSEYDICFSKGKVLKIFYRYSGEIL